MINNGDLEQVLQNMGIDRDFYMKLVKTFLSKVDADLEALKQGLESGNYETLVNHSHAIKSSTATLRLEPLRTLAEEIQQQAENRESTTLAEKLEELHIQVSTLREEVDSF
jgi:HPt (histidine-containing phosphotransfer) domain-containing protein